MLMSSLDKWGPYLNTNVGYSFTGTAGVDTKCIHNFGRSTVLHTIERFASAGQLSAIAIGDQRHTRMVNRRPSVGILNGRNHDLKRGGPKSLRAG